MRLCILGTVVCLLLGGCTARAPKVVTPTPSTGAEASAKPPATGLVEHFASKLAPIAPQAQPVADAVAQFAPKDTLAEADVPAQPVTGQVAGKPFICRYAGIWADEEARQPTLWLRFSGQPRPSDGGLSLDDTNVNLEIPRKPEVGTWTRAFRAQAESTVAAFYTIEAAAVAGATPQLTTGSRYDWACWLRIDEERGPVEQGGISSVVGRLVLVFDDAVEGRTRSWVAGRFIADGHRFQP
ncbi:MAG: hypothetical protein HZB16_24355 [Armatimonadetes bacterium]|nr:hypothetical protein [Armatimonadota bacterium]